MTTDTHTLPASYLQMHSTVTKDAELRVGLGEMPIPTPKDNEVLIRIEAAPINPSDQAVMFGWASMQDAKTTGEGSNTVLTAPISSEGMRAMKARVGQTLPLGNEGAGTVVAAGANEHAQSLVGKVVAALGGQMYAQYVVVDAMACLPLQDGHTAKDGASSFVNPLTALSMVETMRMEGHTALVHTAAASNLGQMLNRICIQDGVDLVNIVRKQEQVDILKALGAKYIVNSNAPDFMEALIDAVHATGATIAFDATGGGTLASNILTAMEAAAARTPGAYSVYGSIKHKQVYLYGGLDTSPTTLSRSYGMAWGVGGWLLPNFLAKAGKEVNVRLRTRVAKELKTTFASNYTQELTLAQALQISHVSDYTSKATGEKFLLTPQK